MMHDLQYPIGKYIEQPFSDAQLQEWLLDIRSLPLQLEYALLNLDEIRLQTPYRPGGWTVHQLVHHVADSHMNAYIRCKLGLTEETPVIKTYEEAAWAELPDTANLPVNISVTLLHSLHLRWYELLKNTTAEQYRRKVLHPAQQKEITLCYLLGLYAWHGNHHVAHIANLRTRNEWY